MTDELTETTDMTDESTTATDETSTNPVDLLPVGNTDVLAEENVEELLPVPVDFTGDGELFMLRVRGESMIELGILDGDFVVATQITNPNNGDIVVAGIPGGEATIKTYSRSGAQVTLTPANSTMSPMEFTAEEVEIYGKVVTVMRRY